VYHAVCFAKVKKTLWLVGLFAFAFGLGAQELHKFEALAARDIESKLSGEAMKVEVKAQPTGLIGAAWGDLAQVTIRAAHFSTEALPLFTEPKRSKKGVVRQLDLVLNDFTLAGLRIEHLEASIPDCRFDLALALSKKQIRLSRSGVGTGRVRILERDLEAFILKKFKEIKRVAVKIDKYKVFVEGYGEFLIVQSDFLVIANLTPLDGNKLVLTDAVILLNGHRADEAASQALLSTLNPVVDLDRDLQLHGAIHVRGLRLQEGVLEAWGDTKIPDLPGFGLVAQAGH
jgi:hypothetical protein